MSMRALLVKSGKYMMEVRTFAMQIFKIISNINPKFMEDIFIPRSKASYRTRKQNKEILRLSCKEITQFI